MIHEAGHSRVVSVALEKMQVCNGAIPKDPVRAIGSTRITSL